MRLEHFHGTIVVALLVLVAFIATPGEARDTRPEGTSLRTELDRGGTTVKLDLPLTQTTVNSDISGFLASVEVQQTYVNPYDSPVEAIYTFPLPNEASVHEMVMKINDRILYGELKEEEQARQEYEEAKEAGKRASLLEQNRPNVFTQSVANIMPGDTIQIVIRYSEILDYEGGEYTSVIPSVVGPRYTPGTPKGDTPSGTGYAPDTDRVPDASEVTPRVMGPGVTSNHRLQVNVELDAGFPITELTSPSHDIEVQQSSTNTARINLAPGDTVPNKDFILNYGIRAEQPAVTTMFHRSHLGGFMSLIIQPQTTYSDRDITPKDVVFVLDESGSMRGNKMDTLRDAVDQSIGNLRARDRLKIITFDNNTTTWMDEKVRAEGDTKERARQWVRDLSAGGGTNMLKALNRAMEVEEPEEGRVQIILFVTDGLISNEDEILKATREKRGRSRVFTMGIGSSPNRYVLEEMANQGRGSAAFVRFDENPEETVSNFFAKISNPYLVDLEIEDPDGVLSDVLPNPLPDLFVEEPLYVVGQFDESGEHPLTVKGSFAGEEWSQSMELDFPDQTQGNVAIPRQWAKKKIGDLMQQSFGNPGEDTRAEIIRLSKNYQVMSDFTSFVAVDRKIVRDTDSEDLRTEPIPVELPEGMRPEGVRHTLVQAQAPQSSKDAKSSADRSKPGDPVLSVDAPVSARDVIAELPGFGRKHLRWNADHSDWRLRFVLPRSFADDVYPISVKIIHPDGEIERRSVDVVVDSVGPRFEPEYLGARGDTPVHRVAIEPIDVELLRSQPADGVDVDVDIRRFTIYFADGTSVEIPVSEAERTGDGRFVVEFERPGPNTESFTIGVEAMDWARNRVRHELDIAPE